MAEINDEPMFLSWFQRNPPDPHDPEMYNRLCGVVGKQAESGFRPLTRAFVRLESEGVDPDNALRIIVFLLAAQIAEELGRDDHAKFGQRYAEALDRVTAPDSFGGRSIT